jgi:hypothetical protein
MAFFDSLTDVQTEFVEKQKIFFVATAGNDGRINLSPKGLDSLRVLDANTIAWLNLTGSGNETAAHIKEQNRMTMMCCSFEGNPLILRVYGKARAIHRQDADWAKYYAHFPESLGARQVFELRIESVQTSCGFAVPNMDFVSERSQLTEWTDKKSGDEIKGYWEKKNSESIDGKPTGIFD